MQNCYPCLSCILTEIIKHAQYEFAIKITDYYFQEIEYTDGEHLFLGFSRESVAQILVDSSQVIHGFRS